MNQTIYEITHRALAYMDKAEAQCHRLKGADGSHLFYMLLELQDHFRLTATYVGRACMRIESKAQELADRPVLEDRPQ